MAEEKNSISTVVKSLMDGAESVLTSKTVVGAPVRPTAILIIKNGQTKVVNIKDQTAVTKLVDMIPDVVDKIRNRNSGMISDDEAVKAAFPESEVKDVSVRDAGEDK